MKNSGCSRRAYGLKNEHLAAAVQLFQHKLANLREARAASMSQVGSISKGRGHLVESTPSEEMCPSLHYVGSASGHVISPLAKNFVEGKRRLLENLKIHLPPASTGSRSM